MITITCLILWMPSAALAVDADTTSVKTASRRVQRRLRSRTVSVLELVVLQRGQQVRRQLVGRNPRQEHRLARPLVEVKVLDQVAEDARLLAHRRPRVGSAVGLGVEALPAEEVVLDELQVGVETERLLVDVAPASVGTDHQAG